MFIDDLYEGLESYLDKPQWGSSLSLIDLQTTILLSTASFTAALTDLKLYSWKSTASTGEWQCVLHIV